MEQNTQNILSFLSQTTGTNWHLISPFETSIAAQGDPPLVIYIANNDDQSGHYYAPENYFYISMGEWASLFNQLRNNLLHVLPTVQFDLDKFMPKIKLPPYPSGYGVVTGETSLFGSISLRSLTSDDQMSLSFTDLNTLTIRASQTLGSLIATFKIKYGHPDKFSFALTSYVAGDFWCTRCKIDGNQMTVTASPKTIKMTFQDCAIEGELGYSFSGELHPTKPHHPAPSHFHFLDASLISLGFIATGIVVLTIASGGIDLFIGGLSIGATAYAIS